MDLKDLVLKFEHQPDPNLLIGFDTFDDAGVYKISDEIALVQTVDYITPVIDDPFLYGQVAAANSLSDIYAMGGKPLTAMNCCNFPPQGIAVEHLSKILEGGFTKIKEAGAVLVGGHTIKDDELKYGLSVTGIIHPNKIKSNAHAQPGDSLILTKPIGTGVIITGRKRGLVDDELILRVAKNMALLNKSACETMLTYDKNGEVNIHAVTDITGFGLLGHSLNIARASKVELEFTFSNLPIYPESLELIKQGIRTGVTATNMELVKEYIRFGEGLKEEQAWLCVDPQTSGGLLICVNPDKAESIVQDLRKAGNTDTAIVGRVKESEKPHLVVLK